MIAAPVSVTNAAISTALRFVIRIPSYGVEKHQMLAATHRSDGRGEGVGSREMPLSTPLPSFREENSAGVPEAEMAGDEVFLA